MTQRFAVETQGVVASIGCMSGYLMTEAPSTYIAPVPFMEVHGVLDTTVSYADNTAMTVYYFQNTVGFNKGAMQNLEYWADLNGCSGVAPEVITVNADYDIRGYSDCTSNAEVRLMSLFHQATTHTCQAIPQTLNPLLSFGTSCPSSLLKR